MSAQLAENPVDSIFDGMNDAHTTLIDAIHGFDVMLEKAEPEICQILLLTRQTNKRQAEELKAFLGRRGHSASDDGSFMSLVHEGVVRTRALFTDIDGDILPAVADGERRILSCYDDVLENLVKKIDQIPAGTFDSMHTLLLTHRGEIENLIRDQEARHEMLDS
ncbi:DUF2383 domain-containing protein [Hoeflea sp.]|uniref:DUF2383 domain-containing protein n=1 Tax=Hoeflea sp. TaxID=1940281 RepID=UPI00374A3498